MRYTQAQKIAYHEAAHVIAGLRFGIDFESVHMADNGGGTIHHDLLGAVVLSPGVRFQWAGKDNGHQYILMLLSGLGASKIMSPHRSYLSLLIGGAISDWEKAHEFLKHHLDLRQETPNETLGKLLDRYLPTVRKFVKSEWEAIKRIGDALIASPFKSLSYYQCVQIDSRTTLTSNPGHQSRDLQPAA